MKRIGRRGAALLLMAGIWIIVGYGQFVGGVNAPKPGTLYGMIPSDATSALWVLSGLFALTCVFQKKHDWTGFVVLLIMPLFRMVSFVWSWVTYVVSSGELGFEYGWLNGAFYALFVGLVILTGGWPEPLRFPPVRFADNDADNGEDKE